MSKSDLSLIENAIAEAFGCPDGLRDYRLERAVKNVLAVMGDAAIREDAGAEGCTEPKIAPPDVSCTSPQLSSALIEKLKKCREFSYKTGEPYMLQLINEAIELATPLRPKNMLGFPIPRTLEEVMRKR